MGAVDAFDLIRHAALDTGIDRVTADKIVETFRAAWGGKYVYIRKAARDRTDRRQIDDRNLG